MKKIIFRNPGLKVVSLMVALVLWFLVAQIDDPQVTAPFVNIPVRLVNTELLTQQNKVYSVLDETDVVRVTVKAPDSIIQKLRASDIVATADVSKLTDINTIAITYTIQNTDAEAIKYIKGDHDVVQLSVEERATKWVRVTGLVTGEVAEGYTHSDIVLDQTMVEISGAKSVVETIQSAIIKVDVSGATSKISLNAEPELYNKEGKIVSASSLEQNFSYVHAEVDILATKEVPINVTVTGTPAEGYLANGQVELSLESVVLAGSASTLSGMKSIEIPESYTDITDLTDTLVVTYKLKEYLAGTGIEVANRGTDEVVIKIGIEKKVDKVFKIDTAGITLTNIPEGYTAKITDEAQGEVKLRGLSASLGNLQTSSLNPVIDVGAWLAEHNETVPITLNYEIPAEYSLPKNVEFIGGTNFTVVLTPVENS